MVDSVMQPGKMPNCEEDFDEFLLNLTSVSVSLNVNRCHFYKRCFSCNSLTDSAIKVLLECYTLAYMSLYSFLLNLKLREN